MLTVSGLLICFIACYYFQTRRHVILSIDSMESNGITSFDKNVLFFKFLKSKRGIISCGAFSYKQIFE